MSFETYMYKAYLNANHLEIITKKHGKKKKTFSNPATWEISLSIINASNNNVSFDKINAILDSIIEPYQNKILNETTPFDTFEPNIRNLCYFIRPQIEEKLREFNCAALCYKISENPTLSYIYDVVNDTEYYQYKLYLSASHAIRYMKDDVEMLGEKHEHSFVIDVNVVDIAFDFSNFRTLATELENAIKPYQNQFLNEMEEFKNIPNPTLETITNYFKDNFINVTKQNKCYLSSVKIAESPSVAYILNQGTVNPIY